MTPRLRPLVLIIDDTDDTREVYAYALQLEGFAMAEARDGRQGVQTAVDLLPDVIITDLAMPIMNGWETIRRLRADHRTRHIPVIACSGHADAGTIHHLGADVLLGKPCSLDLLLREVRRLLRTDRDAAA